MKDHVNGKTDDYGGSFENCCHFGLQILDAAVNEPSTDEKRSGGYGREDGIKVVSNNHADLISHGRWLLANPDLPNIFELNAPHNKYGRNTFYTSDPDISYIDYPFLE
ncbi:hypothetical protein GIB67_042515 [Kingdonia uniflora]|uniref:Uncharacterized protein n=1 Tax=Kingdonia uniflora TaxID=39325 RepID=A0A7J7M0Z6_9MAGN|nr:hypothetical protein GIB67_042515 [Kingdonia uniflora]